MDVRVGYPPDSFSVDVAYYDGLPVGTVERFVRDAPDPDWLGPYIRRALTGPFEIELSEGYSEVGEARC